MADGVRVDHAAEAREFLVRAAKQGTDQLGDDLRVEALVHATLAVAEQQRAANLLAFAAFRYEDEVEGSVLGRTFEGAVALRAVVGTMLGIGDDGSVS